MSEVRIAGPEDLDAVMGLALAACKENGFVNPNPEKVAHEFWSALHLDHGIVGLIGNPGEQAEAGVLLRIGSMWYSDERLLRKKPFLFTRILGLQKTGGQKNSVNSPNPLPIL
jgi:hypothetical protein